MEWKIHNKGNHLRVEKKAATRFVVEFDPTAFYEDLVKVLTNAEGAASWGGKVKDRYNAWLVLALDPTILGRKLNSNEQVAEKEIAAL